MLNKKIDALTYQDILALVADGVRENRTLDYKRDFPDLGANEQKREFLADVSALANTAGGYLLYGVEDDQGAPIQVCGIDVVDADKFQQRIESILQTGLDPRLPGSNIRLIEKDGSKPILAIQVARSWVAPHRVIPSDKFFQRNSIGKFPMDTGQLRTAFLGTEEVPERMRRFKVQRCAAIMVNEGAAPLNEGAKLVLHLIPLSAFTQKAEIALSDETSIPPLDASGWNSTHVLEGTLTYIHEDAASRAYSLLYRTGIVEAAAQIGHGQGEGHPQFINPAGIEETLRRHVPRVMQYLKRFGFEPPYYGFITLISTRNVIPRWESRWGHHTKPLRHEVMELPEFLIPDEGQDIDKILDRPAEVLWNACGVPYTPPSREKRSA